MTTTQDRAREAAGFLTTQQRGEETITVKTDDAPEWVTELVHSAHRDPDGSELFPDDWRYSATAAALEAIADSDDPEDGAGDFADGYADSYNSDLIAWVGSHTYRASYVDEAISELGEARDFYHGLQMGQYYEAGIVYAAVLAALDELDDDEEATE